MEKYRKYYGILILIYFIILVARYAGKSELVYFGGDESRHFMNGVFLKDALADGGWRHPFEYLQWYYLKYPALSVHQYPPLFYLLEAAVFTIFGIRVIAVQGLIFTILGISLYCWYTYLKTRVLPEIALLSLFIFLSMQLFLNNFSRIMLDTTGLSFVLIFLYAVNRWHASGKRKPLYISLALLLVIMMIDFKTYFVVFYLVLSIIYQRSSAQSARKRFRNLLLGFLAIFILFLTVGTIARITRIPLLYRTLQGVNMMNVFKLKRIILLQNLELIFKFQFLKIFGISSLLPVAIGLMYVIRKKDWHKMSSDLLYAVNFIFIFMWCITHFEPRRFNLFFLPSIALLSGYGLYHLLSLIKNRTFHTIALACVLVFYAGKGLHQSPEYFRGYERAVADLISINTKNDPVLCDAFFDGNFIAYMRKYDPSKAQIIFRGDKILFTSIIYYDYIQETYAHNEEDVYNILDRYSIRYILVDSLYLDIEQKALLRKVLQNEEQFRRIKAYPVSTNVKGYEQAGLTLYEYTAHASNYDQPLDISLPVVGAQFSFTINDLKQPFDNRRFTLPK